MAKTKIGKSVIYGKTSIVGNQVQVHLSVPRDFVPKAIVTTCRSTGLRVVHVVFERDGTFSQKTEPTVFEARKL